MQKFILKIAHGVKYGTKIGDRIMYNDVYLTITNIISVTVDDEFVVVKGYGVELD